VSLQIDKSVMFWGFPFVTLCVYAHMLATRRTAALSCRYLACFASYY